MHRLRCTTARTRVLLESAVLGLTLVSVSLAWPSSPAAAQTVEGAPPTAGERIRIQIATGMTLRLGISSPWEANFLAVRGDDLVASDAVIGRPVAVPMSAVESLQVAREKPAIDAIKRGALVGTAVGLGTWGFLKILCGSACDDKPGEAWLPAIGVGLVVGTLVAAKPGIRWVPAPLPTAGR